MMNRYLGIATLMVLLLCFVTGCATYWYQEGKTFEECKQENLECYEEMKRYSSNWEDLGSQEFELMEDCMGQRGYRLVTERELFVRVKREPADPNVPWMIHGVAGFVEEEK
jgi:hypothetical protein